MGLLTGNLMSGDLPVSAYFDIGLGSFESVFGKHNVDRVRKIMFEKIEADYAGEDFMDPRTFYSIYNDCVEYFTAALVDCGLITMYIRDSVIATARRLMPYFGVPESPAFYMYAELTIDSIPNPKVCNIVLMNKIWGLQWKTVHPKTYNKFIRHMQRCWKPQLQVCHNPDPWKTLEQLILDEL